MKRLPRIRYPLEQSSFMNKAGYLYLISGLCFCFLLFSCASTSKNIEQTDLYDKYLQMTKMQAGKDPLIGIWQGSKGGKEIILAVVENDEKDSEKLMAVILNGSEYQFGYSDGSPWFYVSPMASRSTYAGRINYKDLFWSRWYPTKIVMNDIHSFTTYDDLPAHVKSRGGKTTSYMRKEQVITVDDIARSSGTGFLIRNTNLIITAHHVVGKAKSIGVRFPDGNIFPAEIVGRDVQNDIAILRLEFFTPSAERGFQLDSINPGNSGGPILNNYGAVVGIAVAVIRDQKIEGVAFGIKINAALPMLKKLAVDLKENEGTAISADEIFRRFAQDVVYIRVQ
jgi:hypothetical protein